MEIRLRTDFSWKFLFFSAFLPRTKSPKKFGRNVSISGRKEFLVTYCASFFFTNDSFGYFLVLVLDNA